MTTRAPAVLTKEDIEKDVWSSTMRGETAVSITICFEDLRTIITLKSDKKLDFEKIILKCIPTYIPADIFLSNLKSLMSFYLIFKWRGKIHWTKSRIELRSPGLILNLNLTWTHHCIVGKGTWKFLHDIDNSNFSRDVCLIMFFYWSCLSRKRFC